MKITKLECIPFMIPMKGPMPESVVYSFLRRPHQMILKMHTDEGIVGIGEPGGMDPYYTGDSLDSVIGFIKLVSSGILLGADPFDIDLLVAKMKWLAKFSFQGLGAVDCALHDIVGKKLGIPIYKYLGGLSAKNGTPLGFVLSTKSPEVAAQRAVEIFKAGYTSIKIKTGHLSQTTVQQDLANLTAVREAVGWDARVGIDANGGWDYYQALDALRKMEKFNLFMAEQPVPWREIDNLARLRQKVGTPICADESATDFGHLLEIIEKDAADVLFFKLGKIGGIRMAQKWVAVAKAAGIPVMCGSLPSTAFETAWQAHFLASDEWATHLEHENLGAIIGHNALDTTKTPVTDDLARTVPRVEKGRMYPPDGPGLGLELNEELLAKYAVKEMYTVIE